METHNVYFFSGARTDARQGRFNRLGEKGEIVNWPVFRAGTFRDSTGMKHTYTIDALDEMVENFQVLQMKGIFSNVPVRADHYPRSADKIQGYIRDLKVEGNQLLADVELTEPDAVDKYERGTYRGRSSEIGPYVTNDGEVFTNTFLGVAFVDIPAVEGLFSKDSDESTIRTFTEAGMKKAPGTKPPDTGKDSGDEDEAAKFAQAATAGAAAAMAIADKGKGGDEDEDTVTFNWQGKQITADEVQAQLDLIANAQAEQLKTARADYAKSLVDEKRFVAPQLDKLTELFHSMDAEVYAKAQEVFSAFPELSLLANHNDGVTNADGTQEGGPTEFEQELATVKEMVAFHRRAGLPKEQIENTESFKRLQVLEAKAEK